MISKRAKSFFDYNKILFTLSKVIGAWMSGNTELVAVNSNYEKRIIDVDTDFVPATKDNGWKFSMVLSYDLSNNINKEQVAETLNNLISDTIDPLPRNNRTSG